MRTFVAITVAMGIGLVAAAGVRAAEEGKAEMTTIKGEVIDMVCYLDHGAMGAKHAACAKTCIGSGLPVGLRTAEGKVYLLVGEHKPINSEIVEYAAQTVTMRGKLVSRDGYQMLENAQLVKE